MSARVVLDVSRLPEEGFDRRAPIWWGNLWMLAIETTMFGIVVATYLYLRQNFQMWPPPLTEPPTILDPIPDLYAGTANLALLLLSCAPVIWLDVSARAGRRRSVQIGLVVCIACGIAAMVLRRYEFSAMQFRWDSNAYGSIVWFTLGMHMLHLLAATLEAFVLATWVFLRPLDLKHRVDITTLTVYWYWVVGVWVVLYAMLYFVPRWSY